MPHLALTCLEIGFCLIRGKMIGDKKVPVLEIPEVAGREWA